MAYARAGSLEAKQLWPKGWLIARPLAPPGRSRPALAPGNLLGLIAIHEVEGEGARRWCRRESARSIVSRVLFRGLVPR